MPYGKTAAKLKRKRKAMKHADKPRAGAKKRKKLPAKEKVGIVMSEFKRGTLHSSSGEKVTNPKQAIAIGLSEARAEGAKIPKKGNPHPKRNSKSKAVDIDEMVRQERKGKG